MPWGEKRTDKGRSKLGGGCELLLVAVMGQHDWVVMVVAAVFLVRREDTERGSEDAERTERRDDRPGEVGVCGDVSAVVVGRTVAEENILVR